MSFNDWLNLHDTRIDKLEASLPDEIKNIKMDPVEIKEVTLDNIPDYENYFPFLITNQYAFYINIRKDSPNFMKISRMKFSEVKPILHLDILSWNSFKNNFQRQYFKLINAVNVR